MKQLYIRSCNNCGQCCKAEVCPLGEKIGLKLSGEYGCEALERSGDIYVCGLYTNTEKYVLPEKFIPNFDKEVFDKLPEHVKAHFVDKAIELVREPLKLNFGVGCDSLFGSHEKDFRIPIHLMPDEPDWKQEREIAGYWD